MNETSDPIFPVPIDENEIFTSLIIKYASNVLPDFVNQANAHVSQNSWESLKQTIHKIKGSGAGYGYPVVTELCKKIEFELAKSDYESVKKLVAQLEKLQQRIALGVTSDPSLSKTG